MTKNHILLEAYSIHTDHFNPGYFDLLVNKYDDYRLMEAEKLVNKGLLVKAGSWSLSIVYKLTPAGILAGSALF